MTNAENAYPVALVGTAMYLDSVTGLEAEAVQLADDGGNYREVQWVVGDDIDNPDHPGGVETYRVWCKGYGWADMHRGQWAARLSPGRVVVLDDDEFRDRFSLIEPLTDAGRVDALERREVYGESGTKWMVTINESQSRWLHRQRWQALLWADRQPRLRLRGQLRRKIIRAVGDGNQWLDALARTGRVKGAEWEPTT